MSAAERVVVAPAAEKAECVRCREVFVRSVFFVGDKEQHRAATPAVCPKCVGEEIDRDAAQVQQEAKTFRVDARLADVGVNVRKHGTSTLDNFDASESSKALQVAHDFIRDVRAAGKTGDVRSPFFVGPTGTGKTHLAVATMRALMEGGVDPGRVVYDRAIRLITEIQDSYRTGNTSKVLRKREAASLWVVDDIGTEKATEDATRILLDLFDSREGHANIVTSNATPAELEERFPSAEWARLASRFGPRNFRIVRVQGSDRRFQPVTGGAR